MVTHIRFNDSCGKDTAEQLSHYLTQRANDYSANGADSANARPVVRLADEVNKLGSININDVLPQLNKLASKAGIDKNTAANLVAGYHR